ncbi:MAG: PilZ domain-containing protein [bacterium]
MGDLRRHERRKIELKATLKGIDPSGHQFTRDAQIVNLSRGGAYLIAQGAVPTGRDVDLLLWFGDPERPAEAPIAERCSSRVVRVEPVMVADGGVGGVVSSRHGIAVSFVRELDVA